MSSFNAFVAAHHLDIIASGILLWLAPALLSAIVKPEPGSKSAAWLGLASSWGFDAAKFARKLIEVLSKSGPPEPPARGVGRVEALAIVAALSVLPVPAVVAPGCAWLRKVEPIVVHAVDDGSACEAVTLFTTSGSAMAVCLVLADLVRIGEILFAAEREGVAASVPLRMPDGSTQTVEIPPEYLSAARAEVKRAQLARGVR